jgi:hypothetical protein
MDWVKAHYPEVLGGATGAIVGAPFGLGVPLAIIGQAVGAELKQSSNWQNVKDAALIAAAIVGVLMVTRIVTGRL